MNKIQLKFAAEKMTKEQMKNVFGGELEEEAGVCALSIHPPGGGQYWTDKNYTVAYAQWAYENEVMYSDGSYVGGYCCAGCSF